MRVPVADAAGEENDRMVHQGPVSVGRGTHLLQEIGELPRLVGLNPDALGHHGVIVAMVGEGVVPFLQADLAVGPLALFARHCEGDDAGHVALIGQHLEVKH